MHESQSRASAERPSEFWDRLAEDLTAKVCLVIGQKEHAREPVAAYLRDLEQVARFEDADAAVLQVIASARRLLGERPEVVPARAPFAGSLCE